MPPRKDGTPRRKHVPCPPPPPPVPLTSPLHAWIHPDYNITHRPASAPAPTITGAYLPLSPAPDAERWLQEFPRWSVLTYGDAGGPLIAFCLHPDCKGRRAATDPTKGLLVPAEGPKMRRHWKDQHDGPEPDSSPQSQQPHKTPVQQPQQRGGGRRGVVKREREAEEEPETEEERAVSAWHRSNNSSRSSSTTGSPTSPSSSLSPQPAPFPSSPPRFELWDEDGLQATDLDTGETAGYDSKRVLLPTSGAAAISSLFSSPSAAWNAACSFLSSTSLSRLSGGDASPPDHRVFPYTLVSAVSSTFSAFGALFARNLGFLSYGIDAAAERNALGAIIARTHVWNRCHPHPITVQTAASIITDNDGPCPCDLGETAKVTRAAGFRYECKLRCERCQLERVQVLRVGWTHYWVTADLWLVPMTEEQCSQWQQTARYSLPLLPAVLLVHKDDDSSGRQERLLAIEREQHEVQQAVIRRDEEAERFRQWQLLSPTQSGGQYAQQDDAAAFAPPYEHSTLNPMDW